MVKTYRKKPANLYRYEKMFKVCNLRFLDAVVAIVPVKSPLGEIEDIYTGKMIKEKRITGVNV